jgi:ABC-2 type transport system ATP-binding protein
VTDPERGAEVAAEGDPVAVRAAGLVRRFGDVLALKGVGFELRRGEIYGLVGPDGAGKTTTIRALAGLIDVDEGEIRVLGRRPDDPAVREAIGLMPQRYSLYGDLSVGENLRFFRRLFGLSSAAARPRIDRLLEITRLGPFLDRRADDLSGGMYKKLALACALLHEPQVLLLDEPTNGVDPVSRRELWALLGEFVGHGMAVLVSTPYMDEAERCHRVGLVHEGRMLAEGPPERLVRDLDHPVFVVEGGDRAALHEAIAAVPDVRASSPAGARLRVVVAPGKADVVAARLAPLGASLHPARADFEDLFLARIAAEASP